METSTKNPLTHGIGLLFSIVKLVVEDRPLTISWDSGNIIFTAGVLFGVWMMTLFAERHEITTNIALASIAFTFIGFFLVSTSITLYAITRLS